MSSTSYMKQSELCKQQEIRSFYAGVQGLYMDGYTVRHKLGTSVIPEASHIIRQNAIRR